MKTLVIYYTRSGNTKKIAEYIKEVKNADIFEIRQKTPYSDDYKTCVKEVIEDYKAQARPEIEEDYDITDYHDIYLGYPNYCGDMPMAVYTFLEKHDFSSKVIHAYCTHGGSGLANSVAGIEKVCQGAIIAEPLAIKMPNNSDMSDIDKWLLKSE